MKPLHAAAALIMLMASVPGARAATYAHAPTTFGWIDPAAHAPVVWTGAPGGPAAECTGGSAAADDDISQELPIGFEFKFGASRYTSVRVMSNGRLQFGNRFCGYGTQTVSPRTYPYPYPDVNLARTMRIYGADLDPSAGGTVTWASIGSGEERRFVVTWTNVPEWNAAGSFFNLQAILKENGEFVYQFGASSNLTAGKAQIGWELTTADYDSLAFADIGSLAATAIRFYSGEDEESGEGTAGGFNAFEPATPAGSITGVVRTKVSARAFDLAVVALDAARTAVATGFTGSVKLELLDASNNSGALDANGCRASWVPLPGFTPLTLSFGASDAGRKNVTTTATDAWRELRVRMSSPATGTPSTTGCSNDAFALRPASLAAAATDADAQSAGTARSLNGAAGGAVHKAGRPFTITATAYDDAGAITTRYQGSPSASIAGHLLPSSCLNGGPGCVLAAGAFSGSGGTVVSNTASYSEAGTFSLRLIDADWAAVDAADSSADERETRSAPVPAGRFVPDHFRLAAGSTLSPACAAGGFSYMGEPFGVSLTLLAENSAGGITMNYHEGAGAFAEGQLAGLSWVAENADDGVNLAARLNPPATPPWANGTLLITDAPLTLRRAAPDNPDGPFDSLRAGILATEPDATVQIINNDMNPATAGDCAAAGICNAAAIGGATRVRFGRLRMLNAHGSELRALPVPVRAEFWNGSGFAVNPLDACTAIGSVTANAAPSTCTLNPARSGEGSLLSSGAGTLTLAAPGARGCTDLIMTTPAWLLGRWDATDQGGDGALYDDQARSRASFGIFRDSMIFRREIFR
ncbi:MAG: hypothetical protein Fur0039_18600 [Rhodocyclaceae bacterium]